MFNPITTPSPMSLFPCVLAIINVLPDALGFVFASSLTLIVRMFPFTSVLTFLITTTPRLLYRMYVHIIVQIGNSLDVCKLQNHHLTFENECKHLFFRVFCVCKCIKIVRIYVCVSRCRINQIVSKYIIIIGCLRFPDNH